MCLILKKSYSNNMQEKIKFLLVKHKFCQCKAFTDAVGIPNSTVKAFVYGTRKLPEKYQNKLYSILVEIDRII